MVNACCDKKSLAITMWILWINLERCYWRLKWEMFEAIWIKGLKMHLFINPLRPLFAAMLCLLFVSGCATTQDPINLEQVPINVPFKVLVMESPNSIDPDRLHKALVPDLKPELPETIELLHQGEMHAQEYARSSMQSAIANYSGIEVITISGAGENQYLKSIYAKNFESNITRDDADWLRETTGADALLKFRITDYGLTPRSWRKGYITFEVVATLAITAAIAYSGVTAAKTAAGIYLIEETAEETAETYAGFWALDVTCRPVRIEAKLIRLNPLTTVQETSDTGLSDAVLSRLFRKVPQAERDRQLDQATDKAVKVVVSDLLKR